MLQDHRVVEVAVGEVDKQGRTFQNNFWAKKVKVTEQRTNIDINSVSLRTLDSELKYTHSHTLSLTHTHIHTHTHISQQL